MIENNGSRGLSKRLGMLALAVLLSAALVLPQAAVSAYALENTGRGGAR
jgi:hypothetical protein